MLAKVLYASPRTSADFHDQPVHDMRTVAVRGWRNFTSQVAQQDVHGAVREVAPEAHVLPRGDVAGVVVLDDPGAR